MALHPDFVETHARVFYDDLEHAGYYYHEDIGVWDKSKPKKEQRSPKKKSPTKGIPERSLFKVRILAHNDIIDTLVSTTQTLFEMGDCTLVEKGRIRPDKWKQGRAFCYLTFKLPK